MSSIFTDDYDGLLDLGHGRPVLLLHGFCGSAASWLPILGGLARQYRVLAPDWPGYGHLAALAPLPTVVAMAEHALALLDQLEIPQATVIGHSMSGYVVQELLRSASDRLQGAVLYGAGLTMDHRKRFESAEETLAKLQLDGVSTSVARIVATWFVQGTADPAFRQTTEAGSQMSYAAARAAMCACREINYQGKLNHCTTPTLVIAGSQDRSFPPEITLALARELANSELCLLPWAAHAAHAETPTRFLEVVDTFSRSLA